MDSFRSVFPGKEFLFVRLHSGKEKAKNVMIDPNSVKEGQAPEGSADLWDNPHSTYLGILFETGITGLVLLILFLRGLCQRFGRAYKSRELLAISGCLLAFLIAGVTQFPDRLARNVYIFPILLAMFMVHTEDNETA